jgi:hypothetical protein
VVAAVVTSALAARSRWLGGGRPVSDVGDRRRRPGGGTSAALRRVGH